MRKVKSNTLKYGTRKFRINQIIDLSRPHLIKPKTKTERVFCHIRLCIENAINIFIDDVVDLGRDCGLANVTHSSINDALWRNIKYPSILHNDFYRSMVNTMNIISINFIAGNNNAALNYLVNRDIKVPYIVTDDQKEKIDYSYAVISQQIESILTKASINLYKMRHYPK